MHTCVSDSNRLTERARPAFLSTWTRLITAGNSSMASKFGDVAEYRLDVEMRYKGFRYKSEMCVSDDALMVVIYIYISLVFCLYIYMQLYISPRHSLTNYNMRFRHYLAVYLYTCNNAWCLTRSIYPGGRGPRARGSGG